MTISVPGNHFKLLMANLLTRVFFELLTAKHCSRVIVHNLTEDLALQIYALNGPIKCQFQEAFC